MKSWVLAGVLTALAALSVVILAKLILDPSWPSSSLPRGSFELALDCEAMGCRCGATE